MKRLVALMLLLGSGSAWADPVLWNLYGVTFDDGETIFGSFVYDADSVPCDAKTTCARYLCAKVGSTVGIQLQGRSDQGVIRCRERRFTPVHSWGNSK